MCARQYHMQKHPILSPWNFPRSHLVWGLKDTNNSSQYENLKRFQGNKKVYIFQKKLLIRFGNRIEHYLAPNLLVEIHLANFFQWLQQNDLGVVSCYLRTSTGFWKKYKHRGGFFQQHWLLIYTLQNTSHQENKVCIQLLNYISDFLYLLSNCVWKWEVA